MHTLAVAYASATDWVQRVDAGNALAQLLGETNPAQALRICREVYDVANGRSHPPYLRGLIASLQTQAQIHYYQGKLTQSLTQIEQAINLINNHSQHEQALSDLYRLKAMVNRHFGNDSASQEDLRTSHSHATTAIDVLEIIADAHQYTNQYAKAFEYHQQALALAKDAKDAHRASLLLSACSRDLNALQKFEEGKYCAERAYYLAQNTTIRARAIAAHQLGIACKGLAQLGTTEKYLDTALRLSRQAGLKLIEMEVMGTLGTFAFTQNQFVQAGQHWQMVLEMAQTIQARKDEQQAHQALTEVYEAQAAYKDALHHFKQYQILKELMQGDERRQSADEVLWFPSMPDNAEVNGRSPSQPAPQQHPCEQCESIKLARDNWEKRYRFIFYNSSVAMMEKDISKLRLAFHQLADTGVSDWGQYFKTHPEFVEQARQMMQIVTVNEYVLTIYGIQDPQEILDASYPFNLFEPVDSFLNMLAAIAEGKTYYEDELIHQNSVGYPILIRRCLAIPAMEDPQQIMLTTLLDITAQKHKETTWEKLHRLLEQRVEERTAELNQANDVLRNERDVHRHLLETAKMLILLLSSDGDIMYVNPYLESVTGYTFLELVGKDWFDLFLPVAIRDAVRQQFMSDVTHLDLEKTNHPIVIRSGQRRDIEWSARSLIDGQDQFQGVMIVGNDMTDLLATQQRLQRFSQRLQILQNIERAILSLQTPQEIAKTALAHLRQLVPASMVYLAILDLEREAFEILSVLADYPTQIEPAFRLPITSTRILNQLATGNPVVLTDPMQIEYWMNRNLSRATVTAVSLVLVPLIIHGDLMGILVLFVDETDLFSDEDQEITRELANSLALILQNSRLLQASEARASELSTSYDLTYALNQVAVQLGQSTNAETVIRTLGCEMEKLGIHCAVALMQPDAPDTLKFSYISLENETLRRVQEKYHVSIDNFVLPLEIYNAFSDALFIKDIFAEATKLLGPQPPAVIDELLALVNVKPGMNATIVPMQVEGEVLGGLILWGMNLFIAQMPAYSIFANQAAIAIRNARLLENERLARARAETLREVSSILNLNQDMADLLHEILVQLEQVIEFDSTLLYLIENEQLTVMAHLGLHCDDYLAETVPVVNYPGIARVVTQSQPLIVHDLHQDGSWLPLPVAGSIRSWLGLPLYVQNETIGVLTLAKETADYYSVQDAEWAQAFANQAALAIKNVLLFNEIQHHADDLENRIAERTHDLQTLYEVTAVTSERHELSTMLHAALASTLKAFQIDSGAIYHIVKDDTFDLLTGIDPTAVYTAVPPRDSHLFAMLTRICKAKETVIQSQAAMMGAAAAAGIMRSYVGTPLVSRGRILGAIVLCSPKPSGFRTEEIALLGSIADRMAVAIDNAILREQAEQLAVMEERERLARELHDSVTQLLYSLNLFAQAAKDEVAARNFNLASEYLTDIGHTAQQSLREMRLLLYELKSNQLLQDGFVVALRNRLESVEQRGGISTKIEAEGVPQLPSDVEEGLFRIAQEALNNALKHAQANQVTVRIIGKDGRLQLQIRDNGSGFDPSAHSGGMGLKIMRERVQKLNGRFHIQSQPNQGTRLLIELPLPPAPQEEPAIKTGKLRPPT